MCYLIVIWKNETTMVRQRVSGSDLGGNKLEIYSHEKEKPAKYST
jgi:hypothetical protein